MDTSHAVPADRTGTVLDGRYRLLAPVGRGGMGVVYRAEHRLLGRAVAVKVLRREFSGDARVVQRFRREAVAAGALGDPHIVQVLDLGTEPGGSPYVVMELVEGRSLRELLAEAAPLPVERAVRIACQLLGALSTAHAKGIVHRDLKPSNVMLVRVDDEPDFVKLLDFGICKLVGVPTAPHLTRAGALVGTPGFMAPEQILAGREIDHRVDLWAVGALLYLALTGRRPYEGPGRAGEILATVERDVPPPRVHRGALEPALEAVVLRALARERDERFATAADFRSALLPFRGEDFAQRTQRNAKGVKGEGDRAETQGAQRGRTDPTTRSAELTAQSPRLAAAEAAQQTAGKDTGPNGDRTPTTPVSGGRESAVGAARVRGSATARLAALAALAALGLVGGDICCRRCGGSGSGGGTGDGYSAPSPEPAAPSPSSVSGGGVGSGGAIGARGG